VGAYDQNGDTNPIHALERGECTTAEFEQLLAARIARRDGVQVLAEGLLTRMFAGSVPTDSMYDAVRAIRAAGVRTGLLSNSGGLGSLAGALFPGLAGGGGVPGRGGRAKAGGGVFRARAGLAGARPAERGFGGRHQGKGTRR